MAADGVVGMEELTASASDPEAMFKCVSLRCTMRRGVCVRRQEARFHKNEARVFEICARGNCAQGQLVKLGLRDWTAPAFKEMRADWRDQKKAKRRAVAVMKGIEHR